jgi:tRNA uridine 5-carboxymethylaminomethyl modification enzyme
MEDYEIRQVEIRIRYDGYIRREEHRAEKMSNLQSSRLPPKTDYRTIRSLRKEAAEKLTRLQPDNLFQASRISGVNPSDIAILSIWLRHKGVKDELLSCDANDDF